MSLTKQCHLYSLGTDSFYTEEEKKIHKKLLKLYKARNLCVENKTNKQKWKKSAYNRIIKKQKDKLIELLNAHIETSQIRELSKDDLKPKNIISLFLSSLTRAMGIQQDELTTDLFVINIFFFQVFEEIIKNGFLFNGEKYVFLTASAGQIRTKKCVFIKESVYNQIQPKIMCGLTVDEINDRGGINTNKFLAYLALANSATDIWEDFDIDKSIVVEDFETEVPCEVDYIDDITYEIVRKKMNVPIPHMDGAGIMLDSPTRMVRLPWVKGLLIHFPFDEFIREKCPGGKCIITDIYGDEHDILGENIRYIFTKSQFKLAKYYASWNCYKSRFKAYNCEACFCNMEEEELPKSRINYQMLQTLTDMKDEEIDKLIKNTVEEIKTIGNDYPTTMRLLGATTQNKNPSYFQQALMIYPELFKDEYSKDILKQTKKSLVKQAKAGRLRVNGEYRFLSPDLYAFCEWLFLGNQNPDGLLEDGEVYCKGYKNNEELACLRSPHLYREWAVRKNKRDKEIDKWFGNTECIYTSCHDTISKILQFD